MISPFSLRLCRKACLIAEIFTRPWADEGKKIVLPFFWYFENFPRFLDFKPKMAQNHRILGDFWWFWPKKSQNLGNFSKYQKNGGQSFLPWSEDHFDPISASYDSFWQILSKKCEIIENRKKLPKMPKLNKIVFFSQFFLAKLSFLTLNQ